MRVAIGADHGGFALKQQLVEFLRQEGHDPIDVGTNSTDAVDYPDYAVKVGEEVRTGRADLGVMVDGAGIGSAMTLNKLDGILAAVCNEIYVTRNSRAHNGANVMTLGSMVVGPGLAKELVKTFITTEFEGGRHQKRVDKIHAAASGGGSLSYQKLQTIIADIVRRLLSTGIVPQVSGSASVVPSKPVSGGKITRRVITDDDVRQAAKAGQDLILGRSSVVTPLARDTARDMGVALRVEE